MLTQEERDRIEGRLKEERADAVEALRDFQDAHGDSIQDSTGELTMYRFHPADIGTEVMEQEKQFLLASHEGQRLYEIDEALRRLYSTPEAFGVCQRCGREIAMERLEVIPWATHCADCQKVLENAGPTAE